MSRQPGSPAPSHDEIESLDHLDQLLASGRPLTGVRLQDLDLSAHRDQLIHRTDVAGLVVLGGRLPADLDAHLRAHRALIFPTDPHTPVNPYRATLYSADELYADLASRGYAATPDARAYQWSLKTQSRHDAFATLLRAIHDDSMSDALTETLVDRSVIGVMGGHALKRGTDDYAQAARLGRELATTGAIVLTGGGPGAMEAANLGAFSIGSPAAELERALTDLAAVPSFHPDVTPWAQMALQVRDRLVAHRDAAATTTSSIGVPTWFYGHEPPNVFADGIAKYFSNALREDGLLAHSVSGLIVLPGAAGTTQEIFQAITPRYYADDNQPVAPLVLVGREHWSQTVPVWEAITALGAGRRLGAKVHLVDTIADAAAIVSG